MNRKGVPVELQKAASALLGAASKFEVAAARSFPGAARAAGLSLARLAVVLPDDDTSLPATLEVSSGSPEPYTPNPKFDDVGFMLDSACTAARLAIVLPNNDIPLPAILKESNGLRVWALRFKLSEAGLRPGSLPGWQWYCQMTMPHRPLLSRSIEASIEACSRVKAR